MNRSSDPDNFPSFGIQFTTLSDEEAASLTEEFARQARQRAQDVAEKIRTSPLAKATIEEKRQAVLAMYETMRGPEDFEERVRSSGEYELNNMIVTYEEFQKTMNDASVMLSSLRNRTPGIS